MSGEGLTEGIFEQRPADCQGYWGKTVPDRESSMCKGPGVEGGLICLGTSEEASVAGAAWAREENRRK